MDDIKTPKPEKPKEKLRNTRKAQELSVVIQSAAVVIAMISVALSLFDYAKVSQKIPPVIYGVISGIISLGILLYAIWFIYQRQQKQKKEVEDALRNHEQDFLNQVHVDFFFLLNEKAE